MKITLEFIESVDWQMKSYLFTFEYQGLIIRNYVKAKNGNEALEVASSVVQFTLMHAGLELLNWKEVFNG